MGAMGLWREEGGQMWMRVCEDDRVLTCGVIVVLQDG